VMNGPGAGHASTTMYGYGAQPGYGPPPSGMYGAPMPAPGMRGNGPPTSYHMMSGPTGPPAYQGQVHANPQGGVMNGSTWLF